jgi:peroxiredoxin
MRKNILLIALVILWSCSNKDKVRLSGKIDNAHAEPKIFLYEQQVSVSKLLDSSDISSKGEFKFKIKTTEPRYYFLRIGKSGIVNLLFSPGEVARITADASRLNSSASVSGSPGTKLVLQIVQRHDSVLQHLDSLRAQFRRIKDPSISKDQISLLENDFKNSKLEERNKTIRFIVENFQSMASIMALYLKYDSADYVLQFPRDLQYYKIVSDSLTKMYPSSKQVKALKFDFDNMLRIQKIELTKNLIKNAKPSIPEISLPNPKGDTIKITSFMGKIILLNFWSYESKTCLMINRDYLNLYKKYRNSGLVIYQVSIDLDKEKWLAAVKEIPWTSVAEISNSKSFYATVYNVTHVPASFLIDQKGNILGKDFTIKELDRTISGLLKK